MHDRGNSRSERAVALLRESDDGFIKMCPCRAAGDIQRGQLDKTI